MATDPDPLKLKRVLVLMEFENGSIGAVYSDQPKDDQTSVEVQSLQEPVRPWQDAGWRLDAPPAYRIRVGDLSGLVVHDPGFHDPAVESMALAVMDQWRAGQ